MKKSSKLPSPWLSLVPIITLVLLLYVTIHVFGNDALDGGSQISLLIATAVTALLSMVVYKTKWITIEKSITEFIKGVASAMIVLLLIGALSGTWMVSGVVPTLIYYGMKLLNPHIFLVSCCLITGVVSTVTGSSWTTIATIGVALMGIGQSQGYSVEWIAGAIISGSYLGDKISPLSDTTILAASTTETPLFDHIKYMIITTIPALLIALIVFLIAGMNISAADANDSLAFSNALTNNFNITPWVLLVPVITGVLIAKKVSSLVTLFISALLGVVFALIFQPNIVCDIAGPNQTGISALFKGSYQSLFGSTQIETGYAPLNELVSTSGMKGMLGTVWLILCAMCFGATMKSTGMLESIIKACVRFMKRRFGMVTSTVFSGVFLNACTADQYISIVLTGQMFTPVYKNKGYETKLLSRTTEDAVTVTSPLIPWTTCGMTQSTILGVSTLAYLPYCIFNIATPIISIIITTIGYKVKRKKNVQLEEAEITE